VHEAKPDFERLWGVCRRLRTTGAYLFAFHPDGQRDHLVARQFPVDVGYPEDAATGVAAAALAAYLAERAAPTNPTWLDIDVDQGDAMGRPSRLHASAFADADGVHRTRVSGRATRWRRGSLNTRAVTRSAARLAGELR
jgi:PhzF family phenazine biosynthesis protein